MPPWFNLLFLLCSINMVVGGSQFGTVSSIIESASMKASKYGPKIYISIADEPTWTTLYMPWKPSAERISWGNVNPFKSQRDGFFFVACIALRSVFKRNAGEEGEEESSQSAVVKTLRPDPPRFRHESKVSSSLAWRQKHRRLKSGKCAERQSERQEWEKGTREEAWRRDS